MGPTMKFHPHTGAPIEPLWIRPDGRAMWPILGASPDDPPADPPPADPPTPPAPPAPPSDPPADPPANPEDDPQDFEERFKAQQKVNRDLERKLNEARDAQKAQIDALAKALGLKDDEPQDPEKLAAQVAEEQGKARDAQVQLAIYRTAAAAEANADLLVDSSSFRAATKDVDPTDVAAMTEAIKAFVEANPAFKAAPGAPATPPFPGGPRPPAPTRAGSLGEAIQAKIAQRR